MIVNIIQQTNLTKKNLTLLNTSQFCTLHIEELRVVLKIINLKFDFICIATDSKLKLNTEPKIDIKIDDYRYPVGTATQASKGGVLIYAKEGIEVSK